MKFFKYSNFEDIHLFETSILGSPIQIYCETENILILPVINLVSSNLELEVQFDKAYLIFEGIDDYNIQIQYYSHDFRSFVENVEIKNKGHVLEYSEQLSQLGGLGLFKKGLGSLSLIFKYEVFNILYNKYRTGYTETDLRDAESNDEYRSFLTNSNSIFLIELVRSCRVAQCDIQFL